MKRYIALIAVALTLSACATKPGEDPLVSAKRQVAIVEMVYGGVRATAVSCTAGIICKDEGVIAAIKTVLPTADLAVAEGTRLMLANASDSDAVVKYFNIAMSAVNVLTKALQSFGVKL